MKMKNSILCSLLATTLLFASCGGNATATSATDAPKTDAPSTETTAPADTSENLAWTDKAVSILIPGKPGGGSDLTTRYLTQTWTEQTGVNFKPVNFDTTVASFNSLVGEKPDGQTIEMAHSALITQYVTGASDVNPLEDVTVIANIGNNGLRALAVPADAPYNTFEEFLTYMKANPGTVKAGISPNGTTQFLMGTLENKLDIKFTYVEASAETDRLTSLAGGFIDIGSISLANGLEYEKAGKLKVICTVGADGAKIADFDATAPENYKTIQEMGYDDVYSVTNYYVVGPKGMDSAQVEQINKSLADIATEGTAYYDGMIEMGQVPEWHDVVESIKMLEDETETLTEVAKSLDIYSAN